MVKYATALRLGTAEAEQVLRRFTRGGPKHPTYKAIEELGKAVKSVFVAEYVAAPELRREIHEGLQVVENWNSGNTDLFYGSAGTIPGSDKEHQEVSMLSLHLLQSALVFINTLLVQSVLKDPAWQKKLTDADKGGLSPLFDRYLGLWNHFSSSEDDDLFFHVWQVDPSMPSMVGPARRYASVIDQRWAVAMRRCNAAWAGGPQVALPPGRPWTPASPMRRPLRARSTAHPRARRRVAASGAGW